MKTYVYIDGFNLYYGSVKKTPYKWLDLMKMCQKLLRPYNDILAIKYFTALVHPTKKDPQKQNRQEIYLKALTVYIPEIEIITGQFLKNDKIYPLVTPKPPEYTANVRVNEEKGSDVNLAVHFINDAWMERYECGVIISNDSDFAEAVKIVRQDRKKIVGIINPQKTRNSKELSTHASFSKRIRTGILKNSQLPLQIPNTNIHKPPKW